MTTTVRFAPSPTGYLHIGNARPALLNYCVARRAGGRFILRYDDTDRERSTQVFADAIATDLAWLGIEPDLVLRQSDRIALYDQAADRLRDAGRLYPCYETEEELERRRRRQMARGLPPIYDRAALALSPEERTALEAEGRKPYWRFLLERRSVAWQDGIRGAAHVEAGSLSDPVLVRADGLYLYTLTSVVDDIDTGVTLVLRGEDHVTNTAVQIELFEALGAEVPAFAHHNLLTAATGEGLSKRTGSLSLHTLREDGIEPMAVASLAVLTGTAEAVRPLPSLDALAELVDLSKISRAPARFDPAELDGLNARLLHETPFQAVANRLAALGIGGGEAFWLAVRGNLVRLKDAAVWWRVVAGDIDLPPRCDDAALLRQAAALLPPEPWSDTTWSGWTAAVKAQTGASGKRLFLPLRLALTGLDHGPELRALLPLIGRGRALQRLEAAAG
jgi:glutamyl-tRNA synthetase